jgi:hypothetical protein
MLLVPPLLDNTSIALASEHHQIRSRPAPTVFDPEAAVVFQIL